MFQTLLLKEINLFFVTQKVKQEANAIVLAPAVLVRVVLVVLLKGAKALIITL